MVSHHELLDDSERDPADSLRDKLATAEFEVNELRDAKLKLESNLSKLRDVLENKQFIIDKLQQTICDLTKNLNKRIELSHVTTQTDTDETLETLETSTQTQIFTSERSSQTNPSNTPVEFIPTIKLKGPGRAVRVAERDDERRSPEVLRSNQSEGKPRSSENKVFSEVRHKKKVMLLADSQGKGSAKEFRKQLPQHVVESVVKPYATIENVTEDINNLTRGYGGDDFVVLFGGKSNVINGHYPSDSYFYNLFAKLNFTNVIYMSVPFHNRNLSFDNDAYKYNCRVYNIIKTFSHVRFIDVNSSTDYPDLFYSVLPVYNGRSAVVSRICKFIINHDDVLKDSKFVNWNNLIKIRLTENFHITPLKNMPF